MSYTYLRSYSRVCFLWMTSLCAALLLNSEYVSAQAADTTQTAHKKSISVTFQPFFLLNNAAKFDVELQAAGKKRGIVFTAEVYSGRLKDTEELIDPDYSEWDEIAGAGIGISGKYKFKNQRSSPYVTYGITYRYQEIGYQGQDFYSYEEDGLSYFEYGLIDYKAVVSSALFNTTFGYQKVKDDYMYDLYFGFGYKAPLNEPNFRDIRRYDFNITKPGSMY
jgi:hypothetical protein